MRAKTINEKSNFERTGMPKDQMGIGLGPSKYIPRFEKIITMFSIAFIKDNSPEADEYYSNNDVNGWIINDPNPEIDGLAIYCINKPHLDFGGEGWYVYGTGSKSKYGPDKNPWGIVRELLYSKYSGLDNEISATEESLGEMKRLQSKLKNLNNYLSDEG